MPIGAKLQALFTEKGTNVNEVATRTGISPNTIYSLIRRDSEKANIDDLYKVAHHLGVTLNYFIDSPDNTTSSAHADAFSIPEIDKIKKYRTLDEHGMEIVDLVLDAEYRRCTGIVHNQPQLRIARSGKVTTEPLPIPYDPNCDTSDLDS